ncbi:MAG: TadG family pilus assembly protein [Desulfoplanes sp.]
MKILRSNEYRHGGMNSELKSRADGFKRMEKEKGAVVILVSLSLLVLLGVVALAIDTGHLMVIRNELQNAADAAALAGANNLYSKTPSGFSSVPPVPNWSAAEDAASTNAPSNKSAGGILGDYEVETGYWNFLHNPEGLQLKSISPDPHDDGPAVKVTVRKVAGKNNGPVRNFFAGVMGIHTSDVSATAIAACGNTGWVQPGTLMPVAIPKWIVIKKADKYNNSSKVITVGSAYHYEDDPYTDAVAGQWTSLTEEPINSAKHIKDLIQNGNPNLLSIGDPIYIEPGTKAVGYHKDQIGQYVGKDIVLPVVDAVLRDSVKQIPAPEIKAFIGFHLTELIKNKGFKGYFLEEMYVGPSGPGGWGVSEKLYSGTYSPPRLVK